MIVPMQGSELGERRELRELMELRGRSESMGSEPYELIELGEIWTKSGHEVDSIIRPQNRPHGRTSRAPRISLCPCDRDRHRRQDFFRTRRARQNVSIIERTTVKLLITIWPAKNITAIGP